MSLQLSSEKRITFESNYHPVGMTEVTRVTRVTLDVAVTRHKRCRRPRESKGQFIELSCVHAIIAETLRLPTCQPSHRCGSLQLRTATRVRVERVTKTGSAGHTRRIRRSLFCLHDRQRGITAQQDVDATDCTASATDELGRALSQPQRIHRADAPASG